MLSTRNLLSGFLLIFSVLFHQGAASCQEITILDTLDYLPYYYENALENNLMVAASKGLDREIVRLISKGADVNGQTYEGATPLIFAVAYIRSSTVRTILAYNPDLNIVTSNGETALIISVKNQTADISEALIRAGADIDLPDKNGAGPLHYASINGSFEMADLLLYYEANPNLKSRDGTTPLMAAIYEGYADIADLLIQNGANLEARDNEGFTPMLIAAQNGDTLVMDLLLKEGVEIYERNNQGNNALTISVENNHFHTVEYLLRKGDKWNSAGNEGVNPYRLAYSLGRKEILDLLEQKNIKGKSGLTIGEVSAGVSAKLNNRDAYLGFGLLFREPLINAGIVAGYDFKPYYTRVLVKKNEDILYQYYDKSTIVYGGIFKNFLISESPNGRKWEISASLSGGYNFGNRFRGTNETPESRFRIIPSAGIRFQQKHITVKTDIEYTNTGYYRILPVWLKIGISYSYFTGKRSWQGKTIKWN